MILTGMTIKSSPFKPMETLDELPVREGYAAWAACYDDDGNPLLALEGPAMRRWFGPLEGRRALDLGCGTGRHTVALVAAGARVAALDFTPEMIDRGRRKPPAGRKRPGTCSGSATPCPARCLFATRRSP